MTPVEIVLMVLRGIATLGVNPKIGGGGIGAARTSALLQMLATLIEGGQEAWEELKVFAQEIQALVDQNGEPTRGQWEAMTARDVAARGKLTANRERLLAEEPAPEEPEEEAEGATLEELTKAELQAQLDAAGVEYKAHATKDELVQLVQEHIPQG